MYACRPPERPLRDRPPPPAISWTGRRPRRLRSRSLAQTGDREAPPPSRRTARRSFGPRRTSPRRDARPSISLRTMETELGELFSPPRLRVQGPHAVAQALRAELSGEGSALADEGGVAAGAELLSGGFPGGHLILLLPAPTAPGLTCPDMGFIMAAVSAARGGPVVKGPPRRFRKERRWRESPGRTISPAPRARTGTRSCTRSAWSCTTSRTSAWT